MNEFNKLCKQVEKLDPVDYAAIIIEKTAKIMPALRVLTDNPAESVGLFASFLIASVCADGKLDESEYLLILPALKLCFGEDFDYESAKAVVKAFKPEGKEIKKVVDGVVDLLGMISENLKDDVIILCLLICAVDGKVSLKEKNFIKQLIR